MTPTERRAYLERIDADLRAEIARAEEAYKPLSEMCGRAASRINTLKEQLKRIEAAESYFAPHNDPDDDEAALDAALGRK